MLDSMPVSLAFTRAEGLAVEEAERQADRFARGAAQLAILAALEHGSHTARELVTVTAMSSSSPVRWGRSGGLLRLFACGPCHVSAKQ
jgi:hypothetical protein